MCWQDQFKKAAPVQGGIGMYLLQKMGWKQGTGLGKSNEGNIEPLQVDVKMDRKGERWVISLKSGITCYHSCCPVTPESVLDFYQKYKSND